jgi:hypothetical protein
MERLFVRSDQTEAVLARFRGMAPGETCPWHELTRIIGKDAQRAGRHHVESAKRIMLNEDRLTFLAVVGVGIKRIQDKELPAVGVKHIRGARGSAIRGGKKVDCVRNYGSFTREEREYAHKVKMQLAELESLATTPRMQQPAQAQNGRMPPRPE